MEYEIHITEGAWQDLQYFKAYEQRLIVAAIESWLSRDAASESEQRKKLRPNMLAPWEVRSGKYRVFYVVEEAQAVKIVAIGFKEHNDLFIRGKKVRI